MASPRRKSANIYDYPEHLNPFHEEDNHNRLRFWTVTKKKPRSNSFSFQSIKEFRGSIRLPRSSRNRADTSSLSQLNCLSTTPKNENHTRTHSSSPSQSHNDNRFYSTLRKLSRTFSIRNKNKSNSDNHEQHSPIENDVEIRVRPSPRPSERLSVAPFPLPRSRFQDRVKKTESVSSGSLNVDPDSDPDDKNPFSNDSDQQETEICKPVTPVRKKKKAPPPPVRQSSLKAKSLADYQAQKQNEQISTNETETITNIEIKVEQVDIANTNENIEENITENSTRKEETPSEDNKVDTQIDTTVNTIEQNIPSEDNKVDTQTDTTDNKIEQIIPSADNKLDTQTDNKIEQNIPNTSEHNQETTDNLSNEEYIPNAESSINYNTELSLETFCTPEETLEDPTDLIELVTKLQMEVEKLTDDTNNNVIETEEERKIRNIRSWIPLDKHKTEMNVNLNKHYEDDDDVVSAPMSPRLVRLRQDNDWIKPQQ